MILQSSYGCYLTQSADVPFSERQFINNTFIPDAEAAKDWMEITEAEKEEITAKKVFFGSEINYKSITLIGQLQKDVAARINDIGLTPEQALELAGYYPEWNDIIGRELTAGFRFRYEDQLYEVLFDHIALAEYMPAKARIARYKIVVAEPDPEPIPDPEVGNELGDEGVSTDTEPDSQGEKENNISI